MNCTGRVGGVVVVVGGGLQLQLGKENSSVCWISVLIFPDTGRVLHAKYHLISHVMYNNFNNLLLEVKQLFRMSTSQFFEQQTTTKSVLKSN